MIEEYRLQQIAIEVCQERGMNPYESVPAPALAGCVPYHWYRWQAIAEEVKTHLAIGRAIARHFGH